MLTVSHSISADILGNIRVYTENYPARRVTLVIVSDVVPRESVWNQTIFI